MVVCLFWHPMFHFGLQNRQDKRWWSIYSVGGAIRRMVVARREWCVNEKSCCIFCVIWVIFPCDVLLFYWWFLFLGFTPGAKELFKQENYMALYRLPSDEMVKEVMLGKLSFITKRRPPLSHMISLFVRDTTTSKIVRLIAAVTSLWDFNLTGSPCS